MVASSKSNIDNNIGDIWNSGQTRKNTSSNVSHKGKNLESGKQYFWKVRIWDEDNRTGDYSEIQSFKMGVPDNQLTTANIFQLDNIKPQNFTRKANGIYFIDFGKDAFANLKFNYESKIGRAHV